MEPDPDDETALISDQLTQFRGCNPSNDCYFDCCQAAREDIEEHREGYPGELAAAETWAATQAWA